MTDGYDEVVGTSGRDDTVDDSTNIGSLISIVCTFMEQFFDDIGKLLRQRLAYLHASVF